MSFWFRDEGLSDNALSMLHTEDQKQRIKWGNQNHSAYKWYVILGEEVGELGQAILQADLKNIIKEGIHVATLALKIAWMAKKKLED